MTHILNFVIEKSGTVKEDAFFTILKLHGVDLAESEKTRLKKGFSRANKINYNDALHSINIDLDSAVLNEEKWTVPEKATGGYLEGLIESTDGDKVTVQILDTKEVIA